MARRPTGSRGATSPLSVCTTRNRHGRSRGRRHARSRSKPVLGALDDAGLGLDDVDGVSAHTLAADAVYDLRSGAGLDRVARPSIPILALFECVAAISAGLATVVVLAGADAGTYLDRTSTAPWTRPNNEFVAPWGLFTAAEFALVARAHMDRYGTTPGAARARRDDHPQQRARQPGRGLPRSRAVHDGRRPGVADDRRPVPPARLLDDLRRWVRDRARPRGSSVRSPSAAGVRARGRARRVRTSVPPPARTGISPVAARRDQQRARRRPRRARARSRRVGLAPSDVDVLELYDPFSFEIIRQLEAYGFCAPGEGGPFVEDGNIDLDGSVPGEHRRRADVLQPRRLGAAAPATSDPGRAAGPGTVPDPPGRGRARRAVQQRRRGGAVHERRRRRERAAMTTLDPRPGRPPRDAVRAHADLLGRLRAAASCSSSAAPLATPSTSTRRRTMPALSRDRAPLGAERRPWRDRDLDGRVAAGHPDLHRALRPGGRRRRRGYQIVTNIVGCDHTEVRTGLRVVVSFHADD